MWLLQADSPILGLLEFGGGRIAVYGDSNCLDSSHMVTNCFWLLKKLLNFTSGNIKDPVLFSESNRQHVPLHLDNNQLPSRRTDVNFSSYSSVVGKELICGSDSRFEVWGTKGYSLQIRGRNRRLPGYAVIDLGTGLNSTRDSSQTRAFDSSEKKNDDNRYFGLFYREDVRTRNLFPAVQNFFLLISINYFQYAWVDEADSLLLSENADGYACTSCQSLASTCNCSPFW